MNWKVRLGFGAELLALFVLLAVQVKTGQLTLWDLAVEQSIYAITSPLYTTVFTILSLMGKWYTYGAVAGVLFLIPVTRYGVGVPMGSTLVLAVGLNKLLKLVFAIQRPDSHRLATVSGYSFPSGHAMYGTVFVGMLAYLLCLYLQKRSWKIGTCAIATVFLLVVGFSRVYLGAHHPTDVLAGYLAGMILLIVLIPAYQRLESWFWNGCDWRWKS